MSSNNTFNTSAARGYLDDIKTGIGQLQMTLESKTKLNEINWNSMVHLQLKKILENEFAPQINKIHARVIHFENAFLNETKESGFEANRLQPTEQTFWNYFCSTKTNI